MSSLPFAALVPGGFVSDPRFGGGSPAPVPATDPVAAAWDEGYTAGFTEASEAAAAQALADNAARQKIELALARLDGDLAEDLRKRLMATVAALCENALAPLALDREALALRVERAVAMLARADDERLLRLHPEDIALLADRLPSGLAVEPDPALDRGSLRLESTSGGVEDGPDHWRRAIAEALGEC